MRYILYLFLFIGTINAQDITLFNDKGYATAYVDDNADIYLWNGTPVAYLVESRYSGPVVIGFNGKFLGWYINGVIYDRQGFPAGAEEHRSNTFHRIPSVKGVKRVSPNKAWPEAVPAIPNLGMNWSYISLGDLLSGGR